MTFQYFMYFQIPDFKYQKVQSIDDKPPVLQEMIKQSFGPDCSVFILCLKLMKQLLIAKPLTVVFRTKILLKLAFCALLRLKVLLDFIIMLTIYSYRLESSSLFQLYGKKRLLFNTKCKIKSKSYQQL